MKRNGMSGNASKKIGRNRAGAETGSDKKRLPKRCAGGRKSTPTRGGRAVRPECENPQGERSCKNCLFGVTIKQYHDLCALPETAASKPGFAALCLDL